MSIASKLTTLNTITNNIKHKLRSWNLMPTPSAGSPDPYGLEDCSTILDQISGTKTISNTLPVDVIGSKKRYAQVSDPNLSPENIVSGKIILGITGTGGGSPSHITSGPCDIEYGSADSLDGVHYYPSDAGYDYFNSVNLSEMLDSNPNKTLKPENIKYGVTIMGVQGSLLNGQYTGRNQTFRANTGVRTASLLLDSSNAFDIYIQGTAYYPNFYNFQNSVNKVLFVICTYYEPTGAAECYCYYNDQNGKITRRLGTITYSGRIVSIDTGSDSVLFDGGSGIERYDFNTFYR